MTDPVIETAQQATQAMTDSGPATHAGWALLGGVVLKVIEAIAKLFGSRKERAEAAAVEADAAGRVAEIALRVAEHSEERAERADEETASHKMALGTCEEQLRVMRAEIRARDEATAEAFRLMREDLDALRAENAKLRREQEVARGMLADLMRNASTPPHGLYTPADVRAAMAQEDDHG